MHVFNPLVVFSAVALLSSIAFGASVQTTSGVLPGYPNDACIISCIAQGASAANCANYADLPCVCTSPLYQAVASACLAKNCTVPEITLAETLYADQCAYELGVLGLSAAASTFRAGASTLLITDAAQASSLSSAYSSYGSYLSSAYSAYGASLSSDYSALGSSLSTQFVGAAAPTSTSTSGSSGATGTAGGDSKASGAGVGLRMGGSRAARGVVVLGIAFVLSALLM